MTFSIAARCVRTGMLGVAVSSSSPAVAARCAYARAQVGAVGCQNITDPTLGPRLLDLMAFGATAPEAVRIVAGSAAHITFRQLLAVDARYTTMASVMALMAVRVSHQHSLMGHSRIPTP
jgi:uncharacterized Ntn-hydrolase superfamily protein